MGRLAGGGIISPTGPDALTGPLTGGPLAPPLARKWEGPGVSPIAHGATPVMVAGGCCGLLPREG